MYLTYGVDQDQPLRVRSLKIFFITTHHLREIGGSGSYPGSFTRVHIAAGLRRDEGGAAAETSQPNPRRLTFVDAAFSQLSRIHISKLRPGSIQYNSDNSNGANARDADSDGESVYSDNQSSNQRRAHTSCVF